MACQRFGTHGFRAVPLTPPLHSDDQQYTSNTQQESSAPECVCRLLRALQRATLVFHLPLEVHLMQETVTTVRLCMPLWHGYMAPSVRPYTWDVT